MVNRAGARCLRPVACQTGVSLIEVLITVLVLSIGLLGLAGLQLSTVRSNQSAFERSVAVVESYSIVDAMRVDRVGAISGGFNIALADAPIPGTFSGNELAKWRDRLQARFGPDATGSVDCNGADCTIVVQWSDQWGLTDGDTFQVTTQVQL